MKKALFVLLLVTLVFGIRPLQAESTVPVGDELLKFFPQLTDDELVIFAIPSYFKLNWSTPRELLVSTAKSYTKPFNGDHSRRSIGHVFMMLKSSGADEVVLTGMRAKDGEENKQLFIRHAYGLGILGADNLGEFEEASVLAAESKIRFKEGTMAYMRFLLSPETSHRLYEFYKGYDEQDQELHYGGANRPLYGEGGGCSAFGVSFVETAGLMLDEYENNWKVNVNIPKEYYGGPLTGNKVKFRKFVGSNIFKSRWANEDEEHIAFSIWDPSLMHKWIHKVYDEESASPSGQYATEQTGKAKGLVFDGRSVQTPQGPMFFDPADCPNTYGRQGGLYNH